jgi:diamine N-acetyltransferase
MCKNGHLKKKMRIKFAQTTEDFAAIEVLARRIVPDFYAPFFERVVAEQLVISGHTAVALHAQAAGGYRHYLIESGGEPVGYFALHGGGYEPAGANGAGGDGVRLQLSHFYVLAEFRGRGLGQLAMAFIDQEMKDMGAVAIELFVLRKNAGAVAFYQRHGFVVAAEVLTRLGEGAVLEDYVMRKEIER